MHSHQDLRQVAKNLHYLHSHCNMIHGDVKSRNVVELTLDDGSSSWILIDLDAACRISEAAGQKLTSSAFYPPEMARYELQKDAGAQPPAAMVVLEMWYFGLMVLQVTLCHSLSHRPPSGDTQMH